MSDQKTMASNPRLFRSIILYSLVLGCSCFSFGASPCFLKSASGQRRTLFDVSTSPLWAAASAGESNLAPTTIPPAENETPVKKKRDLHPPVIEAISHGLLIRAQNVPTSPLRILEEDGNIEPWQITLTAGKIAQQFVEEWQKREELTLEENEEEMQVVSGRVFAVLTRLEELEEELLKRCNKVSEELTFSFGVPPEELKTLQESSEDASIEQIRGAAAAIDAACLFDQQLRYNRAKSLLAMFLHEIEGPGLRRNNVVLPCMAVDFLSVDHFDALLGAVNDVSGSSGAINSVEEKSVENVETTVRAPPSQSLHPVTIDAIADAFRVRAQNISTSPLRLLDSNMEWFDVQYSIMKFAERFLEKCTKDNKNNEEPKWTEEELQTIGGRIVGVLIRLDDLEWEWNHRVSTSTLCKPESPDLIPYNQWKSTLGLHPDNVEQRCIKTLDMALLEENDFARTRAEKMLALFLLNIEGPGMKASGNKAPDDSEVDFIQDSTQLNLMMPK